MALNYSLFAVLVFVVCLQMTLGFRMPAATMHWKMNSIIKHQQMLSAASSSPSVRDLTAKDLLMADGCSGLSRGEINEIVLQLEKHNPTEEPAFSPLLNGEWELVSASLLTPGILGIQAIKQLPGSFLTAGDIIVSIQSASPRVRAQAQVKVGHARMSVAVCTDLQVKSSSRLTELFESTTIGQFKLPLASSLHTFSRDIVISYLDEELLIARDSFGTPEILRRKDMSLNNQGNGI